MVSGGERISSWILNVIGYMVRVVIGVIPVLGMKESAGIRVLVKQSHLSLIDVIEDSLLIVRVVVPVNTLLADVL